MYSSSTNSWMHVSDLPSPRSIPAVAVLSSTEILLDFSPLEPIKKQFLLSRMQLKYKITPLKTNYCCSWGCTPINWNSPLYSIFTNTNPIWRVFPNLVTYKSEAGVDLRSRNTTKL